MNVILNLTIKRQWFDMIASGEKREEYRGIGNMRVEKAYDWFVHHFPGDDDAMVLRNGYSMHSPALAVRVVRLSLRQSAVHPEWGEPADGKHFVISFDKVVARGTYAEVKKALEEGSPE